jgi:hypothetical protein
MDHHHFYESLSIARDHFVLDAIVLTLLAVFEGQILS